jgi:hypothetical protein
MDLTKTIGSLEDILARLDAIGESFAATKVAEAIEILKSDIRREASLKVVRAHENN